MRILASACVLLLVRATGVSGRALYLLICENGEVLSLLPILYVSTA